jgi:hypothetical protein
MYTQYLQFLIEKIFVFENDVELDESNCLNDIEHFESMIEGYDIDLNKKMNDNMLQNITKCVLTNFKCYEVLDMDYEKRMDSGDADKLFQQYKQYKQKISCADKASVLKLDHSIDTKNTFYVQSLHDVTTDDLKHAFGEYVTSGGEGDKYRYEYKFLFNHKKQEYVMSLYDWVDDDNKFYDEADIYWHVASNVSSTSVVLEIIKELKLMLTQCC